MKISELIKKLQILQEKHGDNELRFKANDSFGTLGGDMNLILKVGEDKLGLDWFGTCTNRDSKTTLIEFYLNNDYDNKKPKLTFRS
jgi:hypothetical protein